MNSKTFFEALGIEYDGKEHEDDSLDVEIKNDSYRTYGGGAKGNKNGHYGCKHSAKAKHIMSEKKKGKTPWNKNITGYVVHNEQSKKAIREKLSGSGNGRAILDEAKVDTIIQIYLSKPEIKNVGEVQGNGLKMSYLWAFALKISKEYGTTPAAIKRLLQKKSWKNVWQKYNIPDKD
jgi:hypothetical protein